MPACAASVAVRRGPGLARRGRRAAGGGRRTAGPVHGDGRAGVGQPYGVELERGRVRGRLVRPRGPLLISRTGRPLRHERACECAQVRRHVHGGRRARRRDVRTPYMGICMSPCGDMHVAIWGYACRHVGICMSPYACHHVGICMSPYGDMHVAMQGYACRHMGICMSPCRDMHVAIWGYACRHVGICMSPYGDMHVAIWGYACPVRRSRACA